MPRRRLDPARSVPEVDVIEVHLQDLVLAEGVLDLLGDAHLEDLAAERALLAGQVLGEDVAGKLHGQSARAFLDSARAHVVPHRAQDAAQVDGLVIAEALVLDGDERLGHVFGQRRQSNQLALDGGEVGEGLAVAIHEHGRAAWLVGREAMDVRTAHEQAAAPGHGQEDRERGNPDDDGAHGGTRLPPPLGQTRAKEGETAGQTFHAEAITARRLPRADDDGTAD